MDPAEKVLAGQLLFEGACGMTLAEIATAHGFCDQSHFGREFRRETEMTPREYRERFRVRSGE